MQRIVSICGLCTHHGLDGLFRVTLSTGEGNYVGSLYGIGDRLQAMHQSATHFFWVDNDANIANPVGGLFRAAVQGNQASVRLLPPPLQHLAVAGGTAFVSSGPRATSSIVACAVEGCNESGTVLATDQAYVADIVADPTAVYWTTVGTASPTTNSAAIGSLMRCPLPTCAGGPQKIAENLVNPSSVRLTEQYVYWMTRGASNAATGTFARKRR